ncbi:hypothetical protein [Flavobacterium aquidurense]|uniref:Uncharacterized protein n=1 Tax=Flavobacterium aquidurense TaxID=362413 RepID=A0A0Q0S369_9FLAO|nr:hypothetical protein [Flavobacterium aquidurense]KQB39818.1 hypothetical protein RC62_1512 [Flavobacterium aquidurense]
MKKKIYSVILVMAFVSVSFAGTKEKKSILKSIQNVEMSLEESSVENTITKEADVEIFYTDFAGFVCWLMGGHCQPVETK